MKQIEIQGRTFLYEVKRYSGDYDSSGYQITHFYKPTPIIKTRKKYLFWGPEVNYLEYERLLSLEFVDIESPKFTKEQITQKIMREINLLNRAEEIKRGEIIATPEDARVFVDAITNPPEPNEKLKEAAERYFSPHIIKLGPNASYDTNATRRHDFMEGAKWRAKQLRKANEENYKHLVFMYERLKEIHGER